MYFVTTRGRGDILLAGTFSHLKFSQFRSGSVKHPCKGSYLMNSMYSDLFNRRESGKNLGRDKTAGHNFNIINNINRYT